LEDSPVKSEKTPIKTTVSILIELTWFASQGVSLAQTMPTYQHIVIDPNPSVNGSDTLEKALADINGDGKLLPCWAKVRPTAAQAVCTGMRPRHRAT
jgi:hypothetical protein